MEKQKTSIAFFDFDGTLTNNDSFIAFIRYYVGTFRFAIGFSIMLPYILAMKFGWLPSGVAKERIFAFFFKGKSAEKVESVARKYVENEIPNHLRKEAIEKLQWHRSEGHKLVLVSASFDVWLEPFAEVEGLELVSTRAEVRDGRYTGKYDGKNCNGPEKANRINGQFDLSQFETSYAYGDSSKDAQMLALVEHPFFRSF